MMKHWKWKHWNNSCWPSWDIPIPMPSPDAPAHV
jgi:hypothetical protein